MGVRRTVVAAVLSAIIVLCVAVGATIAATVTKTRRSQFAFSFGNLTATPSVSSQTLAATFDSPGDFVDFDIVISNPDGQQAVFSLSVGGETADSAISLSQFLCYIDGVPSDGQDGRFIGTLASLSAGGQSVYEDVFFAATGDGVQTAAVLRIEYHNTGAPSQSGTVNVTVTCTASSADTQKYTFINSAEELLYTFRAAQAGLITSPRKLIIAADGIDLGGAQTAEEFDFSPLAGTEQVQGGGVCFEVDVYGHDVAFGGIVLDNAYMDVYSSKPSASDGGVPVVSSLVVGTGSFVNFRQSVSAADITAQGFDEERAQTAVHEYLVGNFEGRYLGSTAITAADCLGNLSVYFPSVQTVTEGQTVEITFGDRIYRAYLADGVGSFGDILSQMMLVQRVQTEEKEQWNYALDHVGYDLYLPTTLYSSGDSAAVVWDSSVPSVIDSVGRYNPDYYARTVTLTAAISAYGNTRYFTFFVRAAGRSFEERMAIICQEILSEAAYPLDDTDPHDLITAEQIAGYAEWGLTSMTAQSSSDSLLINTVANASSQEFEKIIMQVVNGNEEEVTVTIEGYFSEDGLVTTKPATQETVLPPAYDVVIRIDVAAVDPGVVLQMARQKAAEVDVLQNILNDNYHYLHTGNYILPSDGQAGTACGQGSFVLPSTYPQGSVVDANEEAGQIAAQYLIGYELVSPDDITDDGGVFSPQYVVNNGAGQVLGGYSFANAGTSVLTKGNIFDINPVKFAAVETSLCIKIWLYGAADGSVIDVDASSAYLQYLEITLPAAFTEGDGEGFTSTSLLRQSTQGATYETDYAFAKVRDAVEDKSPLPCTVCPVEGRKYIMLRSIELATTAGLESLDLSLQAQDLSPNSSDTIVNGQDYKVTSIYGLAKFTNLTQLNLNGTHAGMTSTRSQSPLVTANNTAIIGSRLSLRTLWLEDTDLTEIGAFSSLLQLEDVNLAGNAALRNISPLLNSAGSLAVLDICRTYAADYDVIFWDEQGKVADPVQAKYHYHSVLEEMYDDFAAANQTSGGQTIPSYFVGGHSAHSGLLNVYNPYVFSDSNDDVVREIAKNYAYRFDNITEMTNVIHLQNTVIVADGEPFASINWSIADITAVAADGSIQDKTDGALTSVSPTEEDYAGNALVLDLTPGRFRLTRGYTTVTETGAISYIASSTGWVVNLAMTVTVAGRSYTRNFYITVLEGFDADEDIIE